YTTLFRSHLVGWLLRSSGTPGWLRRAWGALPPIGGGGRPPWPGGTLQPRGAPPGAREPGGILRSSSWRVPPYRYFPEPGAPPGRCGCGRDPAPWEGLPGRIRHGKERGAAGLVALVA